MPSRRFASHAAQSDGTVILGDLLRVKTHREERLRRQIMRVKREQHAIEDKLVACGSLRAELTQSHQHWLGWSGEAMGHQLQSHKHRMASVFDQYQSLLQYQRALHAERDRLGELQALLRQQLLSVMKKKEKMRGLLQDGS